EVKPLTTEPVGAATPKSDKPKASENGLVFHASQSEGCTNSAVTFEVANMADNARCLWNFGDGSFSKDANPKHIFNKSGRFTVTLSVTSAGGGTIQNNYADLIVIHELPEASFNFLKQEYAGHV